MLKGEIIWTEEKIREGFKKFFQEHGRYPSALEVDIFEDLPSSRQIQRKYGGLVRLRTKLGLPEVDYTKGLVRSQKAQEVGKRGLLYEQQVYQMLVSYFGEIAVHEQKPFSDYSGRYDFYVYSKDGIFAIDVFYPIDLFSFAGCVNSKQRLYKNFKEEIILLCVNSKIKQATIEKALKTKKNILPLNIRVLDIDQFKKFIKDKTPLKVE